MEKIIIKKKYLEQEDIDQIKKLEVACEEFEAVHLKLELDYKKNLSEFAKKSSDEESEIENAQEYMCFESSKLVGYLGICHFGGGDAPYEMNGMVHPLYRRQHIFSDLIDQAVEDINKMNHAEILLLCDQNVDSGKKFIESRKLDLHHTEYEMYLDHNKKEMYFHKNDIEKWEINLVEATNQDAREVARQNQIYFSDEVDEIAEDVIEEDLVLPEDEKERGLFIYLAKTQTDVVGKINLEIADGVGGIYGFGVLPEYRKKGYGRKILWQAIKKLDQMKANEIMLQVETKNRNALTLYESCGFVERLVMEYYCL